MSILSALSVSRKPVYGFLGIGLMWGAFAASIPDIKAGLGVGDGVFGLLLILNTVGLITAMVLAPKMDRWLGDRSMQRVVLMLGLCFPLLILAPTPLIFGMCIVVMGLTSGLTDVLINTRVAELEARHDRALMNANHGMFSVAYATAALVMGIFRQNGWPPLAVFCIFGVLVIAMSFFMRMTPDAVSEESRKTRIPLWPVAICGGIVLVAFMTEATVEAWSALHIERTLSGDPAEGAFGPVMLGLTMAFGRFGGQAVSERFSQFTIIAVATALAATGAAMAALAATPMQAYIGFGILGLGVSVIGPLGLALMGQMSTAETRGRAIALASIIGFSGFFFAPGIMGLIAELTNLRVAFMTFAVFTLSLYPLIWIAKRMRG